MRIINHKTGITLIEVVIAFLVLGFMLVPIFGYLTGSVTDTDKIYSEAYAISRAKFVMDAMMFQIPWYCIREGTAGEPCIFSVYKKGEDPSKINDYRIDTNKAVNGLLGSLVPKMFGDELPNKTIYDDSENSRKWVGDGMMTNEKGYKFRIRAIVYDLFRAPEVNETFLNFEYYRKKGSSSHKVDKFFKLPDLVGKDHDDHYNVFKKIIVQVKWSNKKSIDPAKDKNAHSLFLVGIKSDLD